MKKSLKLLSLLILLSLIIISCHKNDDSENSIIGTWAFSKRIITQLEGKTVEYDISSLVDMSGEITFNENGTITDKSDFSPTWKLVDNNKVIEITYELDEEDKEEGKEFDVDKYPFSFKGEILILEDADGFLVNSDDYPDEGNMSFSEFNKMFNETIDDIEEIDVSMKYYMTRKN